MMQNSKDKKLSKRPGKKGILMFATKKDIPLFILATSTMMIASVGSPVQTYVYGEAFNKLAKYLSGGYTDLSKFVSDVRVMCLIIMAVGVVRMFFTWFSIYVWLIIGERQQKRARSELLGELMRKSFEWYDEKDNLMGSMAQVNRCIEEIREALSENVALLVQSFSSIVLLLIFAMVQSWSLTLVILASVPFMATSSAVFGKLTFTFAKVENNLSARASKILDWSFASGNIVRLLHGKYRDLVNFNRVVEESAKAFTKMSLVVGLNEKVLRILSFLIFVQGFWFGAHMVLIGKLSIGQVFTAFSSCLIMGTHISTMANILAHLNKGQAAAATIFEFMGYEDVSDRSLDEERQESFEKDFEPIVIGRTIRFKDVSFHYKNTNKTGLRDISFEIDNSQLTFIVGPSGCGKSTLVSLLLTFYEPSSGQIFIDNHDVSIFDRNKISEILTLVELKPFIFEKLLFENVALGNENATERQVAEACHFAELDLFLQSLENGIHLKISTNLSGGQMQRINIARAFLKDSPILVLDEALSAIDFTTRKKLLRKIRAWRKGRLTLIISHDMLEIELGDKVVSLRSGEVESIESITECDNLELERIITLENYVQHDRFGDMMTPDDESIRVSKDLEMTGELEAEMEVLSIFAILRYCYYTISRKILIVCGLLMAIMSGVLTPILSYCFSKLLSNIVTQSSHLPPKKHGAVFWSIVSIGLTLVDGLAFFSSKFLLSFSAEQWIVELRKRALVAIDDQDLMIFDQRYMKPAELTALLMNDSRDLRNLISEFLSGALSIVALTSLGLIWSIASGWKLALVGTAFVPLNILVTTAYGIILLNFETKYKDKVAQVERLNHNAVLGVKTIKAFGLLENFEDGLRDTLLELSTVAKFRACFTGLGFALQEMCTSIATGTILYYGLYLVGHSEYSYEKTLQVLTLFSFTMASASTLMGTLPEIARGKRAGTLFTNILGLKPLPIETSGSETPKRLLKDGSTILSLKNVSFSYRRKSEQKPVLQNISFTINKSETVGIVGASGSGKSTISLLIGRLIDCDRGSISCCGKQLKNIDPSWYHKAVGVVPQHPKFFEGTIWENLIYGLDKAYLDKSLVVECLKLCNIWNLVTSLHQGLDAKLDDRSVSSGELQRLCIARALIREPSLIVFDECTSNLDNASSEIIKDLLNNRLRQKYPDVTILVITHDPHIMRSLPRLLVLDKGQICQDGTFEDLTREDGVLQKLISS